METRLLKASEEAYAEAARQLMAGEVVGIPTETVYGLAADALDPQAVEKIFIAKGRPQDNPLIVHIARWDQLPLVARDIPEDAYTLGRAFWPGPLTMILRRSEAIPDVVTAGLDTVGIRMPSHPAAHRIIELSHPLAAPSANTSGRPSPTAASHVYEDMKGRVPLIIDGGRSSVGVESTVVDMTGGTAKVLRPGAITEEMIAAVLGRAQTDIATKVGLAEGEKPKSPGMKYRHYAPKSPVVLYEGAPEDTFRAIAADAGESDGIICFDEYKDVLRARGLHRVYSLGPSWDHASHSRRIFSVLRRFDSTKAQRILAQCPREFGGGEGTVNRMRKSAGFTCVKCGKKQIIGVTGSSGSGKSSFCRGLAEGRGDIRVIDADQVYHGLLADPESSLSAKLIEAYPGCGENGIVIRKKLAAIVFGDAQKLRALNEMTHAAVLEKMLAEAGACPQSYVVLDVPLLFESRLDRFCTMTVGVIADRRTALARIASRDGLSRSDASQRMKNQPPRTYYIRRCDLCVENNGNAEQIKEAAISFRDKYLPVL